jgi:hypothetical protein
MVPVKKLFSTGKNSITFPFLYLQNFDYNISHNIWHFNTLLSKNVGTPEYMSLNLSPPLQHRGWTMRGAYEVLNVYTYAINLHNFLLI